MMLSFSRRSLEDLELLLEEENFVRSLLNIMKQWRYYWDENLLEFFQTS